MQLNVPSSIDLVIAGQFPPPVNGFAYITRQITNVLEGRNATTIADIAVHTRERSPLYHLHRLFLTLKGLWVVATAHRNGCRTLYLACEGGLGLVYTLMFSVIARLLGLRVLLHHHSFQYIDRTSTLMSTLLAVLDDRLTHIFLCPVMASRFASRYKRPVRALVLSNSAFVAEKRLSDTKLGGEKPLTLGHLSNLSEEKGLGLFLETLRKALDKGFDVCGVLAGPPAGDQEKHMIEKALSDFSGRLTYLGPVYGAQKEAFFDAVDVFLFPTRYVNEAQPTVIFEAMASGVPVLSYDRGCIKGQVGSCGKVIPREEDFADTVVDWLAQKGTTKTNYEALRLDTVSQFLEDRRQALDVLDNLLTKEPEWITPE